MYWLKENGLCRSIERHNFLIKKILLKNIKSLKLSGRVLDMGAGSSPYKSIVLSNVNVTEYISVDWDNSHHNQDDINIFADLTKKLPIADHYADCIVSFSVLEHLPEPDYFISECSRILKNGGNLEFIIPFMWQVHEEPFDYFRFTKYGIEYLLNKNNFKDIKIIEIMGFWQTWGVMFNYHTVKFAKGPLKYFLYLLWWLIQIITPFLDKLDRSAGESALYSVSAIR
jgi:SAM-dependent methyltransferase